MSQITRELAVVVGATGAFGQAIVKMLIEAGLDVLAVARHAETLAGLVAQHGAALRPCVADIASDDAIAQISAAVQQPAQQAGPQAVPQPVPQTVRMVVHGPGVAVAGGILTAPTAAVVDAVNIKVGGMLRLVRAVDAHLLPGARLVAIAGHYGLEPSAYAAGPGVANAALFNLMRQLSLAYGPRGITAHTLAPGPADTERLHRVVAERARQKSCALEDVLADMRGESSLGEFTTPEQVAWAVSMLLSPHANAMTGSTLMLDAGRRRGLP